MGEYILSVDNLCKSYDAFSLKNVGFNIPRGYIMGFIGKNGAGKSTTIKCIMNLIPYESGTIKLFDLDNRQYSDEIKQRVGYVGEEQYFYENMSVGWTVNFFGGFFPNWDKIYCNELLERFAISPSKKVNELSKGMKMKLALTIALSHKPELLILDEPTSGLDPVIRDELLELLLEIVQDENRSVFFSSHITSDIEKIADYVTIIDDGRIILSDEKDTIIDNWRLFKIDSSYVSDKIFRSLHGLKKGEFGYSGISDKPDSFIKEFRKEFPDGNFIMEKLSLDELLLRIVKDGGEA
ncbi:MAG: ABC transporter ATP-binding protein [Acetivibrionales bacterium]|jgi:ABC-2 type transport system ATP-binding protein